MGGHSKDGGSKSSHTHGVTLSLDYFLCSNIFGFYHNIPSELEITDGEVLQERDRLTSSGLRLVSRTSATTTSVSIFLLTSGFPFIPTRQCSLL